MGLGQAWKQDKDGLLPRISDLFLTQTCLKRGIAADELVSGSWSHRCFCGTCHACRVPRGALVCWCQHTPCPVARRSGVLSCGVLGWVGQQFPEAPGQLPLVKDLGVQVHPARGVQTPQTLPRR